MLMGLEKVKSLVTFKRIASFKGSMATDLRVKEIIDGEVIRQ